MPLRHTDPPRTLRREDIPVSSIKHVHIARLGVRHDVSVVDRARPSSSAVCVANCCNRSATLGTCSLQSSSVELTTTKSIIMRSASIRRVKFLYCLVFTTENMLRFTVTHAERTQGERFYVKLVEITELSKSACVS